MTRIPKDEAMMNSNYERYLITGLPLSRHLTYFADIFPFSIREVRGQPAAAATRALRCGRKPQRRLRKIRRRHLFDQLDDSVLPFASDLLQIRIVLIEPHSRIRQQ